MTGAASPLRALAMRHGIAASYRDTIGTPHEVSDATLLAVLRAIGVEAGSAQAIADASAALDAGPQAGIPVARSGTLDLVIDGATEWQVTLEDGSVRGGRAEGRLRITGLPVGLHELAVAMPGGPWTAPLPVPPARAPSAGEIAGRPRHWGIAAPIYGLPGPLGLGTYRGLGDLAEGCGRLGASYALINPVHALFPRAPAAFSPYSPSHRRFFNIAHVDPAIVPEIDAAPGAREIVMRARMAAPPRADDDLIDYPAFADLQRRALDALHRAFRALPDDHPRRRSFDAWRRRQGVALDRFATYEALAEAHGPYWTGWPAALRRVDDLRPDTERDDRARKHAYFQWLAEAQLADAQARARAGGMAFGLMLDLAVGVRADGAEVWAEPECFASGVSIGAPPDGFNPVGQNWALAPLNPRAMRTGGLVAFAGTLGASMRHAGALRVDHVLGLRRNFWIADETGEGTYIRFPQDALFAVLAIEAERNRCLVVGEDLGNLPDGFRDEMGESGLYGCRLLYFQRTASGTFVEPGQYAPATMASIGSHDLATLREWWQGSDLDEMEAVGVLAGGALAAAKSGRDADRRHLYTMLGLAGEPEFDVLIARVHAVLAASGSDLVTLQLEMVLPGGARLNLPGTTTQYPNWRRKLPAIPEILQDRLLGAFAATAQRSGRSSAPG